ncbi:hypothetical protein, partial [Faecalibaculum rodentium]|uniref:hypothetical protein n=1 Tax=Faecalibaculum rodentium TaxID=1702221 RepID=UPI003F7456C5
MIHADRLALDITGCCHGDDHMFSGNQVLIIHIHIVGRYFSTSLVAILLYDFGQIIFDDLHNTFFPIQNIFVIFNSLDQGIIFRFNFVPLQTGQ